MSCRFYLDDYNLIRVDSEESILKERLHLFKNDKEIPFKYDNNSLSFFDGYEDKTKYKVVFDDQEYKVEPRFISHHKRFDKEYECDVDELGSFYQKEYTTFRLWAPFYDCVELFIDEKNIAMDYRGKGLYELALKGNYKNKKYHYCLIQNNQRKNVNDPFSIVNSKDNQDSLVIDLDDYHFKNIEMKPCEDPIIYECSVRDFTSDPNVPFRNPKTFLGFVEQGLRYKKEKIGLDYLEELGISHIELLPVLNYDKDKSEYNWGYNPLNFNTLSYEYVKEDPIKEFREMIDTLHCKNIRVVLDVVFNHVYQADLFNLEQILPYYCFRYKKDRSLAQGTLCGNEIRSEAYMMKEYLKCIVKRLICMYDIDGLRFDLGGIFDFNTINEIGGIASRIKPDFLLLNEGWHMGDVLSDDLRADYFNAKKMPEYAFFNPEYRDTIKLSYLKGEKEGEKKLLHCFGGIDATLSNHQSINYVECHDGETLSDYLNTIQNGELKENRTKLALALVLLSRGMPFIAGGQEFSRDKKGCSNSYNAGDGINGFDWSLAIKNKDLVAYTKALIEFRKKYIRFNKETEVKIEYFYDLPIIAFDDLAFIINNTEYDYDYHSWITFKDVLLSNAETLHDVKAFKVEKMSLVALKKS